MGEEIDPYQSLVLNFAELVVPANQMGRLETTRYVQFDPAMRNKVKHLNNS